MDGGEVFTDVGAVGVVARVVAFADHRSAGEPALDHVADLLDVFDGVGIVQEIHVLGDAKQA